jgi:hypothetical protein
MVFTPNPKIKPVRSEKYLNFIRSQPCLMNGTKAVAHHEPFLGGSTGDKPSDLFALPLSDEWHTINPYCRHRHSGGPKAFWDMVNVDPMLECLRLINMFFSQGGKL